MGPALSGCGKEVLRNRSHIWLFHSPCALTGRSLRAGWAQRAPPASPRAAIGCACRQSGRGRGLPPRPAGRRPRLRAAGSGGPVWRKRRSRASSASASLALHKMAKIAKTHEGKNSLEGPVSAPAGVALGHRPLLVFLPAPGSVRRCSSGGGRAGRACV